jgi:hypothetical protein
MNLSILSPHSPVLADILINKKDITWFHSVALSFLGSVFIALTAR